MPSQWGKKPKPPKTIRMTKQRRLRIAQAIDATLGVIATRLTPCPKTE
jgi:hypothetical protein